MSEWGGSRSAWASEQALKSKTWLHVALWWGVRALPEEEDVTPLLSMSGLRQHFHRIECDTDEVINAYFAQVPRTAAAAAAARPPPPPRCNDSSYTCLALMAWCLCAVVVWQEPVLTSIDFIIPLNCMLYSTRKLSTQLLRFSQAVKELVDRERGESA